MMAKWLLIALVFLVLYVAWKSQRTQRASRQPAQPAAAPKADSMVTCSICGVHLPRADVHWTPTGAPRCDRHIHLP